MSIKHCFKTINFNYMIIYVEELLAEQQTYVETHAIYAIGLILVNINFTITNGGRSILREGNEIMSLAGKSTAFASINRRSCRIAS